MPGTPPDRRTATLIGDVVSSRPQADRRRLQRYVLDVLSQANEALAPAQNLEPTIGDEFQGAFATIAAACRASLVIRLLLLAADSRIDSRYGLGYGEIQVFDPLTKPVSQDGSAWWSARAGIDHAKKLATSSQTAFARTWFEAELDDQRPSVNASAINAFLLSRDALVSRMSTRSRRLLLGSLYGRSQAELANDEQITQGAVSQNLQRSGANAIAAAQVELERI